MHHMVHHVTFMERPWWDGVTLLCYLCRNGRRLLWAVFLELGRHFRPAIPACLYHDHEAISLTLCHQEALEAASRSHDTHGWNV